MTDRKEKPPYNAGRRIRWLAVAIVVAIAAWTGGWYWLAGRVDAQAGLLLADQRGLGTDIDCADRTVRGYPFRLEVFCSSLALSRPADGLAIDAGGFRSAAQVYDPGHVYAELDSPVKVSGAAAGAMRFDWKLAAATAILAEPLPQRVAVSVDDLSVALAGLDPAVTTAHVETHMRTNEGNLDLALRYEGLAVDPALVSGHTLPVLAGDADLTVKDGVAIAARGVDTLRGLSGEFHRLALLVTPEQGVLVSGPFEIGADGLVSAKLDVYFVDPEGLAATFRPEFPEYGGLINMLAAMPPTPGPDGTPETKLPVNINRGNVTVGLIPVGRIPPLD